METCKTIFLAFVIIFIAEYTIAQGNPPIRDADKLEKEKTALIKTHPDVFKAAEIVDVIKIGAHSKVIYLKDSIYHEAIINTGRKDMLLLETAQLLDLDAVPKVVRDAFKNSQYKGYEISRAYVVTRPSEGRLYRLDIINKKNKDDIKIIYFDHLGHPGASPY